MKNKLLYLGILLLIFLSRLPFIFNSPGEDLDVWREIYSGKNLAENHFYEVSRFPGYPFSEFTFALLNHFPFYAYNLITVFFLLGCVIFLEKIFNGYKIPNSIFYAASFAFIPIIYISSTVAIEYIWSLFFILGCTFFILQKKYFLSAVFFGLIICTRFNNIIFLLPFTYLLYEQTNKKIFATLKIIFLYFFFSFLFFLPVIIKYNGDFLHHYGAENIGLRNYISLATLYIYGFIGCLGIVIALTLSFENINHKIKLQRFPPPIYIFAVFMIITNFIFFIKFPNEAGYLIPSVPFQFIMLIKLIDQKYKKILLLSFFLSPFLITLRIKDVDVKGVIFTTEKNENLQIKEMRSLLKKINSLESPAMVCVANPFEMLKILGGNNLESNEKVKVFILLEEKKIIQYKNLNYKIYYTEEALKRTFKELNYDLKKYGKQIQ